MAYKFKPNKSVAKRLRRTKTGKLKHNHSFTSHLMSARPSSKRRKLRRPAIMFEGHARNMRKLLGISGLHPGKTRHDREMAAEAKAEGAAETPVKAKGREPEMEAAKVPKKTSSVKKTSVKK
ncbi:MAG: 50S ribosomal protein L35 [Planctomycetota bacterium]|nr:50S ribosomal protein L35 [Planctomycetota bacterium]